MAGSDTLRGQRLQVRRGRGDGTFNDGQAAFAGSAFTTNAGGAVADFNGDGWPDLAFNSPEPGRSIAVLLNWTGQQVPPCAVPPLVGVRERRATHRLALAGCRVGHVRRRYSRSVRTGRVIRQRPMHGAVRPNNSPVDLLISRGRLHAAR